MYAVKVYIIPFLLAAALVGGAFYYTNQTQTTQSQLSGIPFGGFVVNSVPCTCIGQWGDFLLTVGPPSAGQYLFRYTSTFQFAFYQLPRAGVWVLGTFSPPGVCLMQAGKICVPYGFPYGTIVAAGTSL